MLQQLLVGCLISLANIAIHAMVMTTVVGTARLVLTWERRRPRVWLIFVMTATVGVLLAAHIAEVITWSLTYTVLEAAPPEANSFISLSSTTRLWATETLFLLSVGVCWAR